MEWISVKDKLPDYDIQVLWVREDALMFIDDIDHDNSWNNFKSTHEKSYFDIEEVKITHWMPLPEPPK